MKRKRLLTAMLCLALLAATFCTTATEAVSTTRRMGQEAGARLHDETRWQVSSSFKFDALCFLNVLTGDPFYVRYYRQEYGRFAPQLTPAARLALANLKRKLKDENRLIVSSFLCLYFSATEDETLEEMLHTLASSDRMKSTLRRTPYFNAGGWRLYESVRADLRTLLLFLKEIKFADYWRENVLPNVERQSAAVERRLAGYNVVSEVERHLGFALPSETITVYMLYFAQPHGMRINGARFIVAPSYPFEVILRNAVHEMMHPPYDLAHDRQLRKVLDSFQTDAFLMDRVRHHNPSFGYNTLDGFIEEDCVRALEQIVNERLNVAVDARRRWQEEDDGIHVFAVALYSLMKQESFDPSRESFRPFLMRMMTTGKLAPGRIEALYRSFYALTLDQRLDQRLNQRIFGLRRKSFKLKFP